MDKSEDSLIEALVSLDGNRNFEIFVGWLKRNLEHTTERLKTEKEDVEMRWIQSRMQNLSEIIDRIENARDDLDKIKNKR